MMKIWKLLGVLLLSIVALTSAVAAADYSVVSLKVNGESPVGSLAVVPGEKLVVQASIQGLSGQARDVKMKAWIGGYEYGSIQHETSVFRVRSGVTYSKTLELELPEDLDTNNNNYKLHVELFDAVNVVERNFNLFVEEPRHNIVIQDVLLVPGSKVEAGEMLYAKVRVENMGYKLEEDIRVEITIPELSLMAKTYIDELDSRNGSDNSESSNTLFLRIPEDARDGTYEMNVRLVYDRGHTTFQETKLIHVEGIDAEEAQSTSLVSVSLSKDVYVGTESTYSILVANMGKSTSLYTVEVLGAAGWADVSVEPTAMSVAKSSTGEFLVKVTPKAEGNHQFTIKVKEGNALAMEKNVTVDVDQQAKNSKLLWIAGGILLLIVAVLVIISQLQGDKVTSEDLDYQDAENY